MPETKQGLSKNNTKVGTPDAADLQHQREQLIEDISFLVVQQCRRRNQSTQRTGGAVDTRSCQAEVANQL